MKDSSTLVDGALTIYREVCQKLVTQGRLTEDDLAYAERVYHSENQDLDDVLISSGILSEDAFLRTLAQYLKRSFWEKDELHSQIDRAGLEATLIPESFIRESLFMPLSLRGEERSLLIVVSRLPTPIFLERLMRMSQVRDIQFDFATSASIASAIFHKFQMQKSPGTELLLGEEEHSAPKNCPKCNVACEEEQLVCSSCGELFKGSFKDQMLSKGMMVGRYQVENLLARGGMAEVYRAMDLRTGKIIALKILQNQLSLQRNSLQRFQREARALRDLKHPGIVESYSYGYQDGLGLYIATELLEGLEFLELLQKIGPLSPLQIAPIVVQICDALFHAHTHEVIHRDLKPDNIFLVNDDLGNLTRVKLIDFGLAKVMGDSQKLTQEGLALGTPRYMSPEQASSKDLDYRTDIYSLAVLLFEAMTARPLFRVKGSYQIMMHHLQAEPPLMSEVRPDINFPMELVALIKDALAKKPDDRPHSMEVFKRRFLSAIEHPDAPAPGATIPEMYPIFATMGLRDIKPLRERAPRSSTRAPARAKAPTPSVPSAIRATAKNNFKPLLGRSVASSQASKKKRDTPAPYASRFVMARNTEPEVGVIKRTIPFAERLENQEADLLSDSGLEVLDESMIASPGGNVDSIFKPIRRRSSHNALRSRLESTGAGRKVPKVATRAGERDGYLSWFFSFLLILGILFLIGLWFKFEG